MDTQDLHLKAVRDALQQRTLTVWIGADLPHALTGVPSRADLAHTLATQHGIPTTLPLAEVAQYASSLHNRWFVVQFLRNALDHGRPDPAPFYQQVARLVRDYQITQVMTTAYDQQLERALSDAQVAFDRILQQHDLPFTRPNRVRLLRLYGSVDQPEHVVITNHDQLAMGNDPQRMPLLEAVRQILHQHTTLILGTSIADPDLRTLLDRITINTFARPIYAVLHPVSPIDITMWRDRGITVLDLHPTQVLEYLLNGAVEALPTPPDHLASERPASPQTQNSPDDRPSYQSVVDELRRIGEESCLQLPIADLDDLLNLTRDKLAYSIKQSLRLNKTDIHYDRQAEITRLETLVRLIPFIMHYKRH